MADEGVPDFIDTNAGNGEHGLPEIGILAQYVKDLSFENPNAPAVFQWQGQPQINIGVNIGVNPVGDDVHEVVLKLEIEAKGEQGVAYNVETLYAGLFAIRNLPPEQMQPFLFAEAPRLLFPFARKVLADAILDGGFPPFLLEPIDFGGLYMQNAAQQQAEATGSQVGDTGQA